MLARRAIAERGTPTTPTTASVIGGIQAQEVVKVLHGMEALLGRGFFFDGAAHQSYSIGYPVHPDCPCHEPAMDIVPLPQCGWDTSLSRVAEEARIKLGGFDAFEFSREVVEAMECAVCGHRVEVWCPPDRVQEKDMICSGCGKECSPRFCHSVGSMSPALAFTPQALGLPKWDVLWARYGADMAGFELAADSPFTDAHSS